MFDHVVYSPFNPIYSRNRMFNPNEKALDTCTAVLSQLLPDVIIEITVPRTNALNAINKILLLFIISSFRDILITV